MVEASKTTNNVAIYQLDRGDQRPDFEQLVLRSPVPVLVDFYADWCTPCRFLHPILEKVASKSPHPLRIVKVNVDRLPDLAIQCQIRGIPTVVLFHEGREVDRKIGVKRAGVYLRMLRNLPENDSST